MGWALVGWCVSFDGSMCLLDSNSVHSTISNVSVVTWCVKVVKWSTSMSFSWYSS